MGHIDFLILLPILCNIVAKGKLLMKNILNVYFQVRNYFLIREIKVSE